MAADTDTNLAHLCSWLQHNAGMSEQTQPQTNGSSLRTSARNPSQAETVVGERYVQICSFVRLLVSEGITSIPVLE